MGEGEVVGDTDIVPWRREQAERSWGAKIFRQSSFTSTFGPLPLRRHQPHGAGAASLLRMGSRAENLSLAMKVEPSHEDPAWSGSWILPGLII